MRVLICAEGDHDVGRSGRGTSRPTEGWMQPMVRRMLGGSDLQIDALTRRQIVLLPRDERRHRPLPPGHGRRALASKLRAAQEGHHIVIFMVDADSNRRQDFERIRDEILDGSARIAAEVMPVACVPMSASESWLLSDEATWIDLGLRTLALLPDRPERAWGRPRDVGGHHPHVDFARACTDASVDDCPETRAALAARIDLTRLRRKCPISFGPFSDDLAIAATEHM